MSRFPLSLTRTLLAALGCSSFGLAQTPQPMGLVHPSAIALPRIAVFAVPAIDRQMLQNDDDQRSSMGLAPRYAVPNVVNLSTASHGTWEQLDAAWSLWRLRVQAPASSHINLGLAQCKLPSTARLMFYSRDYQNMLRPFAAEDVSPEGELWTPVVGGEEMVIEVYVQTAQVPQVNLNLVHVGSGYRFFGAGPEALGTDGGSGSCNVDVVCSQGAAWVAEIPAIAAISTGGSVFCTGFMVNNTAQDGRNFFMTANHCGITSGNAASLVCYWNYQRAVCGAGTGPLTMFNTGATFRSSYSTSDFTLVELNTTPNPAWGITYAGWNRGTGDATSACGIHHPSGDDKKISFENQATTTTSYSGTATPGNGSHVRVIDWDTGTTEGGSSGSPLFDQNHRVIGQLHGGGAACGNNSSDWYGRFSMSWTGGGSNTSRLSNWLDPLGTGATVLDTRGNSSASASAYGTGCYTTNGTFYEAFASGAFDLSGTTTTTNTLLMTPVANGYQVTQGANAWFTPTAANLALGDDALSSARTLPFSFAYPGGTTTQIRMCSNGFIWLNGTSTGTDYSPTIAELCSDLPRLCPLWMDLNPASVGTTHFDVDPSNTAVYCTWLGVPAYNTTTPVNTFQVVLRSSGVVEFRYRSVTSMPSGSLVGRSRGNGAVVPTAADISAAMPLLVTTDAAGLSFLASNRPVQGTTFSATISNIPASTIFAGVMLGWTGYSSGVSLASIGMPGCFQYSSQEFTYLLIPSGTTATWTLPVPTGAVWAGRHMFAQAASLSTGVNALGALSSNGIDLLFQPN